jgi:hypothetical protein
VVVSVGFKRENANVNSLLAQTGLLFLQEHWPAADQLNYISSRLNDNFPFSTVIGFDNKDVLAGRQFGDFSILWRNALSCVPNIIDSGSWRICSVRLDFKELQLLCINVYMPYEVDEENVDTFVSMLPQVIDKINHYKDCHNILSGVFNVDFL